MGLKHSEQYGIMNYTIWEINYYYIEDEAKRTLSVDDIKGIRESYKLVKAKYCSI
jgi:hypothetical protein